MQQYAYMIRRMKEIKESDGSSMLDNSLVPTARLWAMAHSPILRPANDVAGGAQGQIKQGRFIKMKSGTLNSNFGSP
ncbi:MAG: hypothetical protein CM1200mP29_15180 [Verrucomicrobiota bacterium]|nr:MAG: hypothetical protein CM1200mP29_15180 [Verrucomicrobiota bacterium]